MQVAEGRAQYEMVSRESSRPKYLVFFKSAFFEKVVLQTYKSHPSVEKNYGFLRYGTCWTHALKDLETGCKNLDDEVQSRQVI